MAALFPVQRTLLLSCLGAVVAVIAGMVWYRQWSNGVLAEIRETPVCRGLLGVDDRDCQAALSEAIFYRTRTPATLLQIVCASLAAGGGVLLGVSATAREFERRTQVFLLSQSVSRAQWWAATVAIVGVPWVLAMMPLGAAATLSLRNDALYFGDAMDPARFYFSPWSLPLVAVVGLSLGALVGAVLRATPGALLVTGLLTMLIVVGAELTRPYLVPTTRLVSPPDVYALSGAPDGSWFRGTGYLDPAGKEVPYSYACPIPNPKDGSSQQERTQMMRACLLENGIAAGYTDVIESRWFVPLRLLWSGLMIVGSALLLLVGLLRIRRRVL